MAIMAMAPLVAVANERVSAGWYIPDPFPHAHGATGDDYGC